MSSQKHLQQNKDLSLPTPAIKNNSWRFGDLSAAELLPLLQRHLLAQDKQAHWQIVWLNNEGRQVIGLLPKVSWSVYFSAIDTDITNVEKLASFYNPDAPYNPNSLYSVVKTCRDDHDNYSTNKAVITTQMSYSAWQQELIDYSQTYEDASDNINIKSAKVADDTRYNHGLIGFIGYDIAAHEFSAKLDIKQLSQPCAVLGHYDIYLTPANDSCDTDNHIDNAGWQLNVNTVNTTPHSDDDSHEVVAKLRAYLDTLDAKLAHKKPVEYTPAPLILTANWQQSDYQQAFEQTQRYLEQGDCYQINLTQSWQGQFDNSKVDKLTLALIDYLPALQRNTNAPFAGYLAATKPVSDCDHLGSDSDSDSDSDFGYRYDNFELLSCSPELFFTFITDSTTNTQHIRTKPIKGTIPRGDNVEQDLALKQQLIDSDKDRSENVMIVDLLRNDLGKYAKTGSVKVPQLFDIESFSNVHHMVSTITAELKPNVHPLTVLFNSLPAGSITGTPKKRAVEIITELEAAPRGAYCGTLGYMNFDGSGQWNVLIRSLQAYSSNKETQVNLWAGGGITVASDCRSEYQECLDKVGNLLAVLAQK
ncbi:anthranilate synthase component I family protein [Psychrobacter jeotgali]|uniref:anthranilate synthase component I family protein n=1 Tax=Psychrobacter jeotgali TaxID=179010 RepID=UPI00191AEBCA|nr:anthranilate synthase component I family protein [Psychrobacter jeotgali]